MEFDVGPDPRPVHEGGMFRRWVWEGWWPHREFSLFCQTCGRRGPWTRWWEVADHHSQLHSFEPEAELH
jgi:hypothetical protein